MKNPNGYGTVRKLSGKNRRKPYGVYITTGYETEKTLPSMSFLSDILPPDLYISVRKYYNKYKKNHVPTGKQIRQCIGYYETRKEALIALAEYNKSPYDISASNITFSEIWDILYEKDIQHRKTSSRNSYISAYHKCKSLYNKKMKDLRLVDLEGVIESISGMSKATQDNVIILIRKIYKIAMQNDIITKDYSQYLTVGETSKQTTREPFTKEEISRILNTEYPFVDSVVIMLYTGVRVGELLSLKTEHIHLEERWIDLHGTKTKSARRIVPIHKEIIPILEKRIELAKDGYLFHDDNNTPIAPNTYRKNYFVPLMGYLGIQNRTPHSCRHTFISIATACGMEPVLLRKIVGHTGDTITENVYTHAYADDLIKEIDKYEL